MYKINMILIFKIFREGILGLHFIQQTLQFFRQFCLIIKLCVYVLISDYGWGLLWKEPGLL